MVDGLQGCAENLYTLQCAHLGQFHGHIETGLAAHPGEDTVRLLFLDYFCNDLCPEWLYVDDIRHPRIGLYGCRVGVNKHHFHPFLAECTACL